jgi:hypothetical protein
MKIHEKRHGLWALVSLGLMVSLSSAPAQTVATPQADPQPAPQSVPRRSPSPADGPEEWIQLFNGKDLTGWIPKIRGQKLGDNWNDTFRVEDGVIKVRYDKYDRFDRRFGHLFYEKPFSNYILRVEYRFVGEQAQDGPGWAFRNSGVMIHGQDPKTMGIEQDFPVSIEAQLLGGNGKDERPTLNVCTPGTHIVLDGKLHTQHCTNSTSATYHGDQWVTVEIEVHGNDVIRHRIDGKTVLEFSQPQLDPSDETAKPLIKDGNVMLSGGSISLQSESHPCEFRKVEIRILDAAR